MKYKTLIPALLQRASIHRKGFTMLEPSTTFNVTATTFSRKKTVEYNVAVTEKKTRKGWIFSNITINFHIINYLFKKISFRSNTEEKLNGGRRHSQIPIRSYVEVLNLSCKMSTNSCNIVSLGNITFETKCLWNPKNCKALRRTKLVA